MKVRVTPHCLLRVDCLDLVNHMKTFNSRNNQALCRHPFQECRPEEREEANPEEWFSFADDCSCMAEVTQE